MLKECTSDSPGVILNVKSFLIIEPIIINGMSTLRVRAIMNSKFYILKIILCNDQLEGKSRKLLHDMNISLGNELGQIAFSFIY